MIDTNTGCVRLMSVEYTNNFSVNLEVLCEKQHVYGLVCAPLPWRYVTKRYPCLSVLVIFWISATDV